MDLFVQRMIERFHIHFVYNMTPEERGRNGVVMKALSQTNLRRKNNKQNQDPLNNNMALSCAFVHSTPVKQKDVANFDVLPSVLNDDKTYSKTDGIYVLTESEDSRTKSIEEVPEKKLVTAKIYELNSPIMSAHVLKTVTQSRDKSTENYEVEITEAEIKNDVDCDVSVKTEPAWKSLEVLDTTAEYEFMKSLEHSKQYLSTANLLEEIEANLPSNYSLAKPLNHTFHSLATYRTVTRLARMEKNLTCVNDVNDEDVDNVSFSSKRLNRLEMEAMVQQAKIKQAQKALMLSKSKKSMEVENLESEKTLLLANLRLSAACQEIEKLKLLGDNAEKENFGQLTISEVQFLLEDIQKNGSEIFICTATNRENVQVSSTHYKLDCKLCFDQPMKFQNLTKDFVIYIELFCRVIKATKTPIKSCIIKKLRDLAASSFHKTLSISPLFGHGFECVACVQLRLENLMKRENGKCKIQFTEHPKNPVVGNSATLHMETDFNIQTKKCGFLNVFNNTWHRRWYSSSGHFLNSWLYPEDHENDKPPIDSIYLPVCEETVKPGGLDVCIRPHSFVLTIGKEKKDMLFAADTKKDMIEWIDHLNLMIEHIRIWRPNV